jgi:hypothetical protein
MPRIRTCPGGRLTPRPSTGALALDLGAPLDRDQVLRERMAIVTDAARGTGQADARLRCSFSAQVPGSPNLVRTRVHG